jgi:hypothetical protein
MFNISIFLKLDKSRSWPLTAFSKRWIFTQKKIRNFCFIHKLDISRFADNGKWPVQMSNKKNNPFKQNHSGSFWHPDKSGYIWFRARICMRAKQKRARNMAPFWARPENELHTLHTCTKFSLSVKSSLATAPLAQPKCRREPGMHSKI